MGAAKAAALERYLHCRGGAVLLTGDIYGVLAERG
jgi:hypothetical protein